MMMKIEYNAKSVIKSVWKDFLKVLNQELTQLFSIKDNG